MILTSGQVDNLSREELIEAYTIADNTIEYYWSAQWSE